MDTNKDGVITYEEWRWADLDYQLTLHWLCDSERLMGFPEISCYSSPVIRLPTSAQSYRIIRPREI